MYTGEEKDCAANPREGLNRLGTGATGSTAGESLRSRQEREYVEKSRASQACCGAAEPANDYQKNTTPVVLTELYARRRELQIQRADIEHKLSMLGGLINIWQ